MSVFAASLLMLGGAFIGFCLSLGLAIAVFVFAVRAAIRNSIRGA
jgi:hypothetical protein